MLFGVKFYLVSSFIVVNDFLIKLILPYYEEALNSIMAVAVDGEKSPQPLNAAIEPFEKVRPVRLAFE